MAKTGGRNWLVIGGGVAACAACCAPLLTPLFVGIGGAGIAGATAGGLFGMPWSEVPCIGIIAALVAGAVFVVVRSILRRMQAAKACACAITAGEGASCGVGGACDPNAASR